jgi:hypothetical protein
MQEGVRIRLLSPTIHIDLHLLGVPIFSLTAHWRGLPENTTYLAVGLFGFSLSVGREDSGFCNEAMPPLSVKKKPRRKAK